MSTRASLVLLSAVAVLTCLGCSAMFSRDKELAKVAKDWSLVIRAAQVVPVYPLTEDLVPGDVLLVDVPIEQQVELYRKKGFLPLDQHIVRLEIPIQSTGSYSAFYDARHGVSADSRPPKPWQSVEASDVADGDSANSRHRWSLAPAAAFPTYSFKVDESGGFGLAIPISGVPFALGLMRAGSASGTVTISDASTYGLDISSLRPLVRDWAETQRAWLRSYAPVKDKTSYLRVVARVYVAGGVDVTISSDQSRGAQVSAGADRDLPLLELAEGDTVQSHKNLVTGLNDVIEASTPGAKLRFASASRRSVSLEEQFERPLVIGYVGFDFPILEGGRLGAPISTRAQLENVQTLRPTPIANTYSWAALRHVWRSATDVATPRMEAALEAADGLAKELPAEYPFVPHEANENGKPTPIADVVPLDRSKFSSVLDYIDYANETVKVLTLAVASAPRTTESERAALREWSGALAGAKAALAEIEQQLGDRSEILRVIDLVYIGE